MKALYKIKDAIMSDDTKSTTESEKINNNETCE